MSGIYIHIPFCSSFCIYCDFYSVTECNKKGEYLKALKKEILRRKDELKESPQTLYIGGGTPSLLSAKELLDLSSTLRETFFDRPPAEFTVEVNPDDITPKFADAMKEAQVTRVSMGVQSFNDDSLKWMRRRHTCAGAKKGFQTLRESGFDNISLDLIFGYRHDTASDKELLARWKKDLEEIVSLLPEHISSYQMSIEPGSLLAQSGKYQEPSQEICEEEYKMLQNILEESGYEQYEISNFALPGYRSKHNSSYWERVPYLGLGAAAHSFNGENRSWNPEDIHQYILNADKGWGEEYSETLTESEVLEERIMLGLRKTEGIELNESEFNKLYNKCSSLREKGLLNIESRRISIPKEHLFISDSIISELFF